MQAGSKMSVKNIGCMDWTHNDEWYYIDEDRDRFVLTTKPLKKLGVASSNIRKSIISSGMIDL